MKQIITYTFLFLLLQCGKKEDSTQQLIIVPANLDYLEELITNFQSIYLVPISYSCSNCIDVLVQWQNALNNNKVTKDKVVVILARGEIDEYFTHQLNTLNINFPLVHDEYNEFLNTNRIVSANNGACIWIKNSRVEWIGYPFYQKKDYKHLLRIFKNEE